MSTSCPPANSCGSTAQVWLDLPAGSDVLSTGNVSAEACVSWGFSNPLAGIADCCLFTLPIKILNCGPFNVYHLGPTQACDIAYCSAKTNYGQGNWLIH